MEKYQNRREAGQVLAKDLQAFKDRNDVDVLALPRGGVPVGFEIAQALHLPLDVFIVRKLGVPDQPELAMGAIASGNAIIFNQDVIRDLGVTEAEIQTVITKEKQELARRELAYRQGLPPPIYQGRTIILVDDGIATGATIRAAIAALRQHHPTAIIVAVPVADKTLCDRLQPLVEQWICPLRPLHLSAVGLWYEDFSQTEDTEVDDLLKQAR